MGTLYDLLGALPSDDAEGLRTAFRKAAKATHPDINPDNPDAALRFRELVRAYDILTDVDQRATYDELLAIALQPPPATQTQTTRYEVVGKYASNTMAATIISAVLVGGYTVFGLFSKPPSAAEIEAENIPGATLQAFAAALPVLPNPAETRVQREGKPSTDETAAAPGSALVTREAAPGPVGRFERPVPAFASYNLAVQYYPRFAAAYFDRGIVLHSVGVFGRPVTDTSPVKRAAEPKKTRNAAPAPRKPLSIVPPPAFVPVHDRRTPITPALTPG